MKATVFNHTGHKELWDWLSKNPTMDKEQWPGWEYNGGTYKYATNSCFACDYSWGAYSETEEYDPSVLCKLCPIKWSGTDDCEKSIYREWYEALYRKRYDKTAKLAAEIRDLPVKEGVICK